MTRKKPFKLGDKPAQNDHCQTQTAAALCHESCTVGPDMIKPGAVVIDIGINQVQSEDGSSRLLGDVDTEVVKDMAGWITPVPGGVGPVTAAILMRNAIRAHARQQAVGWRS